MQHAEDSIRAIEDAGIKTTAPGDHAKPPARKKKGKKRVPKDPSMKGIMQVLLGGERDQAISLRDLDILKGVAEPYGGLKVVSYDPEDKTYKVQASGPALLAIQEKSRQDAASRNVTVKSE